MAEEHNNNNNNTGFATRNVSRRIFGARGKDRGSRGPISGGGKKGKKKEGERSGKKKWLDILIERVFIYRPYSSAISDWVAGGDRSPLSRPPPLRAHFSSRPHLARRSSTKIKRNGVVERWAGRCTRDIFYPDLRKVSYTCIYYIFVKISSFYFIKI